MSEPFHKLLKDYPKGEWFEAADGCGCGAKYKVRVIQLYSATFGEIEWVLRHKPGCFERLIAAVESDRGNVGWEFMPKTFRFRGKKYYPLKSISIEKVGPCLECGRLIIGVPLIIFIDKENLMGELDFCWECARKLGIMKITKGGNLKWGRF
jgi:hypothetical protein